MHHARTRLWTQDGRLSPICGVDIPRVTSHIIPYSKAEEGQNKNLKSDRHTLSNTERLGFKFLDSNLLCSSLCKTDRELESAYFLDPFWLPLVTMADVARLHHSKQQKLDKIDWSYKVFVIQSCNLGRTAHKIPVLSIFHLWFGFKPKVWIRASSAEFSLQFCSIYFQKVSLRYNWVNRNFLSAWHPFLCENY